MDTNHRGRAEEALTGKVIASSYNVQRSFGYGFAEPVYRRALAVELQFIGVPVAQERSYELFTEAFQWAHIAQTSSSTTD
jgi:GxxExxY protein